MRRFPGRLGSGDSGITPVLAVVLLIGVFVTFFAAMFGAVVPVMRRDQERAHMTSVLNSFLELKRSIEEELTLYIIENAAKEAGRNPMITSYTHTVDVKLSCDPLPILGWLTTGSLRLNGGKIKFSSPNPHYVPQEWIYENGAVILVQEGTSIMRSPPPMITVRQAAGDNLEVWVTTFYIDGTDNVAGSGTATVTVALDSVTVENTPRASLTVTVSGNVTAWRKYFESVSAKINSDFGSNVSQVQSTASSVSLSINGKRSDATNDIFEIQRRVRIKASLF
ncbi:MAG: hypothetical protein QXG10_03340 [Candidatus Hadarchaeales archaeon]